ncbi:MAG: hypothetical protein HC886_04835 [Leptolyngbyaceae cyanobacterium SM1_1_3]|nr:hypothetical protein [Leptolyngbyaceae cyanobacterium SM1_1_3]NJN01891.1 hypothetical protein [Leptolyngbyaceae cyanobacterium RM1_1_2]NJO09673.1 hypothetical protein [Leptolyngbyaceae cyanobacterium SL_1_1]
MARGDQIYAMRELMGLTGLYEHHGIDCGDGTVIHYRKTEVAVVARTDYRTFSQGMPVYTQYQPVSFIADVVVERAESRLGERRYDLLSNNCEHFAMWCKTGRSESAQLTDFGLHLDRFRIPELRRTINQVAQDTAPEDSLALMQAAMGNIAIARQAITPQYEQAQQETETWHRVAQLAVKQGRDDLARAALHRKVAVKQQATKLQTQLSQLLDLQATLKTNQSLAAQG